MESLRSLVLQLNEINKRIEAQMTRVDWFTKKFLIHIPQKQSITFEFRRNEHDISTEKGKKELVKTLVGMSNTFEESFIIFGIEENKNRKITKPGIIFCNLRDIMDNFSDIFLKYASDIPEIQFGMAELDYNTFSCLRVRANNLIPIKFDNKIPIREINEKNEVILNYYESRSRYNW